MAEEKSKREKKREEEFEEILNEIRKENERVQLTPEEEKMNILMHYVEKQIPKRVFIGILVALFIFAIATLLNFMAYQDEYTKVLKYSEEYNLHLVYNEENRLSGITSNDESIHYEDNLGLRRVPKTKLGVAGGKLYYNTGIGRGLVLEFTDSYARGEEGTKSVYELLKKNEESNRDFTGFIQIKKYYEEMTFAFIVLVIGYVYSKMVLRGKVSDAYADEGKDEALELLKKYYVYYGGHPIKEGLGHINQNKLTFAILIWYTGLMFFDYEVMRSVYIGTFLSLVYVGGIIYIVKYYVNHIPTMFDRNKRMQTYFNTDTSFNELTEYIRETYKKYSR